MSHTSAGRRRLGRGKALTLALLAGGLLAAPARAASDFSSSAIGTTGSEFLLMDIGARGIAMGGAYSAVSDDANSLYWNPAGLAKIPRLSISTMYSMYVQNISYQSASYAQRIDDNSVVAAGFRYQDLGAIPETDISANPVGSGTFEPRNYVAEVGWGQSVYDLSDSEIDIDMGVAGRWIHSEMVANANGFGGDLGFQGHFYNNYLPYDLAGVIQNVGVGQKFDQTRDTLPTRGRLGGAIRPAPGLTISLDAILPVNNSPTGSVGCEYVWEIDKAVKAMLRGGFNGQNISDLDVMSGLSLGVGLTVADFTFDYAFAPMGTLGSATNYFSVSFNLPAKTSHRYRER
jgi:hypothetical protein